MATIKERLQGVDFELDFELDPPIERWEPMDDGYVAGPYSLGLVRADQGEQVNTLGWELRRIDGQPSTLRRLTIRYQMSLVALYRVWPTSGIAANSVFVDLPWTIDCLSSAVSYDPLIMGLNADGRNTFSVGLADTAVETRMTGKMGRSSPEAEAGFTSHVYSVQFERPCIDGIVQRADVIRDGLFVSTAAEDWFATLGRYAAYVDETRGFTGHRFNERALLPMWHSWYAFENEIDQESILSQIGPAKELGFGTMQLDAGWNTGRDWVTEEGCYEPNRERFPDFEAVIAAIREADLVPIAHWSPPWLGRSAPNRAELSSAIQAHGNDTWRKGDVDHLCPRTPAAIDHMVSSARHMVQDLGFGGLWYDFVDSLPVDGSCNADHDHVYATNGEAWTAILDGCAQAAREADPDCLLIYRRSHANIHNKPYLTHLWPADAPFDYDKNRREVVVTRAYGAGVLTHACCTCWSPDESDEIVARHLASVVLAGVPAISIDLRRFPQSHLDGIRQWLAFFNKHRHALMFGELRPVGFMPPSAVVRIEAERQAFVGYFESLPGVTPLTRAFDEIFLINAYSPELVTLLPNQEGAFQVEILDHFLRPVAGKPDRLESGPRGLLVHLETPSPSVVHLTRIP